jgi:hypothetical protein
MTLFFETVGFPVGIPHGGDDMIFRSLAVRQLVATDDISSPVRIKTAADAHSMPMMRLRDSAGREILRLLQCLTSLVKDRGGLGGSTMRSDGLEKNLKFGITSCNFQKM